MRNPCRSPLCPRRELLPPRVGWLVGLPTHPHNLSVGRRDVLLACPACLLCLLTIAELVPGHFSPGASMPCMPFQATCWDGDAGAHRKTRPSMQPSAPLARVWVGGGVFKVGSSCWRPRLINCGCHFLENRKARSVIIILTSKVVCVLLPCWRGLPACLPVRAGMLCRAGTKLEEGTRGREGHESQIDELLVAGGGTDIGSLCRHRFWEGKGGGEIFCTLCLLAGCQAARTANNCPGVQVAYHRTAGYGWQVALTL